MTTSMNPMMTPNKTAQEMAGEDPISETTPDDVPSEKYSIL